MSSPTWQDRRFMFQVGKEVREPSRKASVSSDKGVEAPKMPDSPTTTTSTATTASSGAVGSPVSGRRRSSASSQGGLFGGLLANRSGEEHAQRRQSWKDMTKPDGLGGFFSGLVNKPTEKK